MIAKLLSLTVLIAGLTACGRGSVIPQSAISADKASPVNLQMQRQEVKRYDCSGQLSSDAMEVTHDPTHHMSLFPNRSSWSGDDIQSATFTDVQTGSVPTWVIEHTSFYIDHGRGTLNMRVVTGINEIRYHFKFNDGSVEDGSRFINVSYSETHLSGVSEVHPSAQECSPKSETN